MVLLSPGLNAIPIQGRVLSPLRCWCVLCAEEKVEYVGQHIGVVVAESPKQAQAAAALVAVRYGHPEVCCLQS